MIQLWYVIVQRRRLDRTNDCGDAKNWEDNVISFFTYDGMISIIFAPII